jgi:hypothetical protein
MSDPDIPTDEDFNTALDVLEAVREFYGEGVEDVINHAHYNVQTYQEAINNGEVAE